MTNLLIAAALVLAADTEEPAAAMVVKVQGKVELRPARGDAKRLAVMDLLYPGDRLRAEGDSQADLVFEKDGRREQLRPGAEATVGKAGCRPAEAVQAVKKARPAKPVVLDGLRELDRNSQGATVVPRGPVDEKQPAVVPVADSRVLSDQPTFSWQAVPKAKRYRVEVFTLTGRKMWTAEPTEARLPYPSKEKPLPRGREFTWRAYAETEDEVLPCGSAGFYVVSAAELKELEPLRELAASSDPDDLVLAAVGYEAKQLYAEALEVYERLCRQSPGEPAFQAARAVLLERAGRRDEAKAAWAKAREAGFVPG
jgi:hypothetical protein